MPACSPAHSCYRRAWGHVGLAGVAGVAAARCNPALDFERAGRWSAGGKRFVALVATGSVARCCQPVPGHKLFLRMAQAPRSELTTPFMPKCTGWLDQAHPWCAWHGTARAVGQAIAQAWKDRQGRFTPGLKAGGGNMAFPGLRGKLVGRQRWRAAWVMDARVLAWNPARHQQFCRAPQVERIWAPQMPSSSTPRTQEMHEPWRRRCNRAPTQFAGRQWLLHAHARGPSRAAGACGTVAPGRGAGGFSTDAERQ